MKIPIKTEVDDFNPVKLKPCGFVDISQEIVDKYAKGLLDLNMAFEKKWNTKTGDWDIVPQSFAFCPKLSDISEAKDGAQQ